MSSTPWIYFSTTEGWKAKLAWLADPQQTVYTHLVNHRLGTGQEKSASQRPTS